MDAKIIHETAAKTIAGAISFPAVVGALIAAGVEFYHVDYLSLSKTFYGSDGTTVVTPITYEDLPVVAADFSAAQLKAAIFDSQNHGQKYYEFTRRAMDAGVHGYMAYLRGQRITYWGRQGDQHTEWFPGAKNNE